MHAIHTPFAVLILVAFTACATQRTVFVVPQYDRQLARPLAVFFAGVREQNPTAFDSTFAAVAASYLKRDYTFDDFGKALQSLVDAATTRDALLASMPRRESDIAIDGGAVGEPLILYVNPTCDECARVVRIVIEAEKRSQFHFPPVVLRLLPSPEAESIRAATILEVLRQSNREAFASAVLDVLQSVPEGKATLETAVEPYLVSVPSPESNQWKAAAKRLQADAYALADIDIPAPFGGFRGRRVARFRNRKVPFDTFHDADSLMLAISAIDATSNADDTCAAEGNRRK